MAVKTATYTSPYDPQAVAQTVSYNDDEILINFRDIATPEEISGFEEAQGLERDREIGFGTILYKTTTDPIQLAGQLVSNPLVETVEPNLLRAPALTGGPIATAGSGAFQNAGLFAIAFVLGLIIFARK